MGYYMKIPQVVTATEWHKGDDDVFDLQGARVAVSDGQLVVRDALSHEVVGAFDPDVFKRTYADVGGELPAALREALPADEAPAEPAPAEGEGAGVGGGY